MIPCAYVLGGFVLSIAVFAILNLYWGRNFAVSQAVQMKQALKGYQEEQPLREQLIGKDGVPLYGPDCVSRFMAQQPPPTLGMTTLVQYQFDNAPKQPLKKTSLAAGIRGWNPKTDRKPGDDTDFKVPEKPDGWMVDLVTPDGKHWRPSGWSEGAPSQ